MTTDTEPILITDSRVTSIPIVDCGEPLVSLSEACSTILLDTSSEQAEFLGREPDFRLRMGVAKRLQYAQRRLPNGCRLLVKDCFRPFAVQQRCYEYYGAELRTQHPNKIDREIAIEASKYVAPPEMGAHTTGSAIDLTLVNDRGQELDMGTVYDADPIASELACYTNAQNISETARRNRSLLIGAMNAAGFINYPTEWWHWSYGDRYWAFVTSAPQAMYGAV